MDDPMRKGCSLSGPQTPTDDLGAAIIDNLLTLFKLTGQPFNAVRDAEEYVKRAWREHPKGHPITMSLAHHFDATDPGWREKA